MNTCQHVSISKRLCLVTGDEGRTCNDCGHAWVKRDGELRFAEGVVGATAFALLTPRDERTDAMWGVLGANVIQGVAADTVREHTSKFMGVWP